MTNIELSYYQKGRVYKKSVVLGLILLCSIILIGGTPWMGASPGGIIALASGHMLLALNLILYVRGSNRKIKWLEKKLEELIVRGRYPEESCGETMMGGLLGFFFNMFVILLTLVLSFAENPIFGLVYVLLMYGSYYYVNETDHYLGDLKETYEWRRRTQSAASSS